MPLNHVPRGMLKKPRLKAPPKACECHSHIIGPTDKYPFYRAKDPSHHPDASVADFRGVLDWLGIERAVIVQPAAHGPDNTRTIHALREFGNERSRGIAICTPDVTDRELFRLNAWGFKGIRFMSAADYLADADLPALARRLAPIGWHIQYQAEGADALEWLPRIAKLPVPVVIDHIGRMPPDMDLNDPRFVALLKFLEGEDRWLKISGPYYGSSAGHPYKDVAPRIAKLAAERGDRLVWALNWPHPGFAADGKPDPVACLDILLDAVPDETTRNAILADNPARLYGFPD